MHVRNVNYDTEYTPYHSTWTLNWMWELSRKVATRRGEEETEGTNSLLYVRLVRVEVTVRVPPPPTWPFSINWDEQCTCICPCSAVNTECSHLAGWLRWYWRVTKREEYTYIDTLDSEECVRKEEEYVERTHTYMDTFSLIDVLPAYPEE